VSPRGLQVEPLRRQLDDGLEEAEAIAAPLRLQGGQARATRRGPGEPACGMVQRPAQEAPPGLRDLRLARVLARLDRLLLKPATSAKEFQPETRHDEW